jgi:hypothetical protein
LLLLLPDAPYAFPLELAPLLPPQIAELLFCAAKFAIEFAPLALIPLLFAEEPDDFAPEAANRSSKSNALALLEAPAAGLGANEDEEEVVIEEALCADIMPGLAPPLLLLNIPTPE